MLSNKNPKVVVIVRVIFAVSLFLFSGIAIEAKNGGARSSSQGIVKGFVRDVSGKPITGALISIFRSESLELFKQIKSGVDGGFATRLIPGKYTIIAAANGFDSASFSSDVRKSSELVYKFNLQPTGLGRTLPERKVDRKGSMWVIRGSQIRRSIFQHGEGTSPVAADADSDDAETVDATVSARTQTVLETYVGNTRGNSFVGINFATLKPISENSEMIIVGQYGSSSSPLRLETEFKLRKNRDHQLRFSASLAQFSGAFSNNDSNLGQVSLQATDEWRVRDGVILVVGIDYSRFIGSGTDSVFSPRLGMQFDADSKTRIRASYTTQTEERNWQSVIELEGGQIFFKEPISIQDVYLASGKPVMNRSSRLEFGAERILDSRSSLEANVFIDLTANRGVGLISIPLNTLGGDSPSFVVNQQGKTQGARVVYSRRWNGRFSTAGGYAFGTGQTLNSGTTNPANVFRGGFFNTVFGQLAADVLSGTNVKTVFRLSPRATVFAIDPFKGRLAIYDPSLSVVVTQSLPSMGLPIRAEAILDARNLLDYETGVNGEDGGLKVLSQRRTLRGGIKVRF